MNGRPDIFRQWVVKADHDLGTAIVTFRYIPEFLDTITFHCQQAAEKYLKAYLSLRSTVFRRTHDLVYLLDLIVEKDSDFSALYDSISLLQSYAIEVRYPEEIIYLTDDSVREGIRVAKSIRNMVTDKAEIVIDYHEIIDSADFL